MDWHIFTIINGFVCLDSPLSGLEWVTRSFSVSSCLKFTNNRFLNDINEWHNTLYSVCGNDLYTDFDIPLGQVIREWSIE